MGLRYVNPSLAVTLDTWQNITSAENDNDPVYDHIAIQANGILDHNSAGNLAGPVEIIASTSNAEDCKTHLFKITWDASAKKLVAFIDGIQRVSLIQDIVNTIFKTIAPQQIKKCIKMCFVPGRAQRIRRQPLEKRPRKTRLKSPHVRAA